jgi:hypothetical protein
MLVGFASVVDAVRCAVEVQRGMLDREPELPDEGRSKLRTGVNLGDVIAEGDDIFGDGVIVAARLEALAIAPHMPDTSCVQHPEHRKLLEDGLRLAAGRRARRDSQTRRLATIVSADVAGNFVP